MPYSFELVVRVTGNSLQEVDEALVQAAGDRLKARIQARIDGDVNPAPSADVSFKLKETNFNDKKEVSHGKEEESEQEDSSKTSEEGLIDQAKPLFQLLGRERAIKCLARFGAEKVSDIRDNKAGAFIQFCRDVLAGKAEV